MYNKQADNLYNEYCADGPVTTASVERMLKHIGIGTSRKTISALVKDDVICPPTVVTESKAPNGRRVSFSEDSLKELIVYELAISACGLKGPASKNKNRMITYAQETLAERKINDIILIAHMESMLAAQYFVPSHLSGIKRLEASKQQAVLIERVMCALWLAKKIVLDDDYDIVSVWKNVADVLFTPNGIALFAHKAANSLTSKTAATQTTAAKDVVTKLYGNHEAKEAVKCWLEVLMVFTNSCKLLVSEAEAYIKAKFDLAIDLSVEPAFISILYQLLIEVDANPP